MGNRKPISDLPRNIETEKVVIVQPQRLTEQSYTPLKAKKFNGVAADVFQEIFDSILDSHLSHSGSLICDNHHSHEPGTCLLYTSPSPRD